MTASDPRQSTHSGTPATSTARASPPGASTKALARVDDMELAVEGLKRELETYAEADVAGRDTQQLFGFFTRIHRAEVEIAGIMGMDWQPGKT